MRRRSIVSAGVEAYKLRWKRRRLLLRSWRKRGQIRRVSGSDIPKNGPLVFSTMRNEMQRLNHWLAHYRALGVTHFLIVDNASDDGTADHLANQPDVSVWSTPHSYKASRFGVDWLTYLQGRYGHGRWCLTVDADETLIFPGWRTEGLAGLTTHLDANGMPSFGAMMLDLYPRGSLSQSHHEPGADPVDSLPYFDRDGYTWERRMDRALISIRGGVRKRVFFEHAPDHAPHLHKIPLVKWNRRYAYLSSAHDALPRRLNVAFDAREGRPTGVLLHSKFLNTVVARSAEEKQRGEHFTHGARYDAYYDGIIADPDFWFEGSARYEGAEQLEQLGLMTRGHWRIS